MNWSDEVILITGASSGLGRALAYTASDRGATTILISREEKELKKVYDVTLNSHYFVFDLENYEKIPELYTKIKKKVKKNVTMLFNCVGYQVMGQLQRSNQYRVMVLRPRRQRPRMPAASRSKKTRKLQSNKFEKLFCPHILVSACLIYRFRVMVYRRRSLAP